MGEAQPQGFRDLVQDAAEDQGQRRQVGFRGHSGQPAGHPAFQAGAFRHVPGVDEDRRAHRRAVLQELRDAGVVQVAVADVVADLDARVARRQAPVQLRAGRVRVLQRHLAERDQPVVAAGDRQGQVVEDAGEFDRLVGRAVVAEEDRGRRDHLPVDAVGVHVALAQGRVPAGGVDAAELAVADHDDRLAFRLHPQPGPAVAAAGRGEVRPALGYDVGVHVDHRGHQPLPRCTSPQLPQVRAFSSW